MTVGRQAIPHGQIRVGNADLALGNTSVVSCPTGCTFILVIEGSNTCVPVCHEKVEAVWSLNQAPQLCTGIRPGILAWHVNCQCNSFTSRLSSSILRHIIDEGLFAHFLQ